MADRIKSAMAGEKKSSGKKSGKSKSKSGGKKPHEVRVRHSENGGYIMKHSFKNAPGEQPEEDKEYHANDMNELQQHISEHMDGGPEGADAQPSGGPAAAPAAVTGGGGM